LKGKYKLTHISTDVFVLIKNDTDLKQARVYMDAGDLAR
jgi:hypothetical protein